MQKQWHVWIKQMQNILSCVVFVRSKGLQVRDLHVITLVCTDVPAQQSWQWRRNECDGVSNDRRLDCLLNNLRHRSKKAPRLRFTGLCVGNLPVTGSFPSQRASNAENVSIRWCHIVTRPQTVTYMATKLNILYLRNSLSSWWFRITLIDHLTLFKMVNKPSRNIAAHLFLPIHP